MDSRQDDLLSETLQVQKEMLATLRAWKYTMVYIATICTIFFVLRIFGVR